MNRQEVQSSSIKSIGWFNKALEVEFRTGRVYRYKGVPEPVFKALLESESKGHFFNKAIRPHYTYEEVIHNGQHGKI